MTLRAQHRIRKQVEVMRNRREQKPWAGHLGDGSGTVEVPGHPNLWYVRSVGSNIAIPVYRGAAPRLHGYPVLVGQDVYKRKWTRILGINMDELAGGNTTISEVGPHAESHGLAGSDPGYFDVRQIVNVLAYASTGMIAHVNAGWVIIDGQVVKVASANIDLTASIPATGAAYSIIRCNSSGVLSVVDGTPVASLIDLTPADAPAFADGYAAIAVVELWDGMTELSRSTVHPSVIPLYLAQISGVGGGAVTTLDGLTDVDVTGAGEGDLLMLRSAVWVDEAPIDISSDAADITAVNFEEQGSDPAAPTTGHWLIYAKAGGVYIEDDASAVTGPLGSVAFSDAEGDPVAVDDTAAADGTSAYAARRDHRHQLTAGIDDLSDVDTAGKSTGDILSYDGANWKARNPDTLLTRAWGSMYQDDAGTTITVSATNTDYIATGMSEGVLGNMTFQNARELKIVTAGIYKVDWSVSFTVASANQEIEAAVGVGGVRQAATSAHAKIATGTDTVNIGGTGLLNLAFNDLVQIVVRNETATVNINIEHANLSLVFLGIGTGGNLLLESGDAILLESGDNLLAEA